jgi:hypothetical protein
MSFIQKFLLSILPKSWAADMEARSRSWFMRCKECGFEQSVWEAGGIRWKAAGNPVRYLFCQQCGHNTWQTTYRKPNP